MKANAIRRTRKKHSPAARAFFRAPTTAGAASAFFSATEHPVQRKCDACAREESSVQRKEAGGIAAPATASVARHIQALPGRGEPLAAPVRTFFEARLGADLGAVRIHRDAADAQSAAALHAQAYTVGQDIVFNHAKYVPATDEGRRLLSHELVHVLQQRSGRPGLQLSGEPNQAAPRAEQERVPGAGSAAAERTGDQREQEASPDAAAPRAREQEEAAEREGQRLAEPVPIADFATFGKQSVHTDFARTVTFNGRTDATFDGGVGQTRNLRGTPATDCDGCAGAECVQVTGTLHIDYHVSTSVTLPDVPSGLTPCQEQRVRDAINNRIRPHEDQHVAAFATYDGSVDLPIRYKGCRSGLAAHVQAMHDAHAAARERAARAASAALDPFNVLVDLDCEDAPPKK